MSGGKKKKKKKQWQLTHLNKFGRGHCGLVKVPAKGKVFFLIFFFSFWKFLLIIMCGVKWSSLTRVFFVC